MLWKLDIRSGKVIGAHLTLMAVCGQSMLMYVHVYAMCSKLA